MSGCHGHVKSVERGSLVVLHLSDADPDVVDSLAAGIAERVGHAEFLIVLLPVGADLDVLGPDQQAEVLAFLNGETAAPRPWSGQTTDHLVAAPLGQ